MDKRHVIRNIRSNQVVDGSPKLPTAEQILHGEIAINFAKEHETLSLKNDNDEIVAFELRSVSNLDEKLNEEIERAQTAEQANATTITAEETRASQKEKEISDLLGTKTDTKDKETAFGRIAKEINDRTNAINSLDATVGATSVESGKHVAVQVVEVDGILTTLTVTENDIASAAALAKEIEDRQTAIAQEVTDRNAAIDSAIDALDKSETTASAENAHVTVKYSETNGIVSMNVTESDIASAQGLADEITRATNSENTIKETYLKNINVNGIDGAFEENVASVTVQGKDIVLTDDYAVTEYPSSFDNRASHVNAADTIDSAFHHVESTIKTLSEDVITNELTTANSISSLAEVVGVMTVDNAIVYEPNTNTNYLSEASSVHHATVILDNKIKEIEKETKNIRSVEIKDVKINGVSAVDSVDKTAYINLSATNIPLTSAKDETSTIYSELNSIKNDFSNQIEHINQVIGGGTESLDGKISRVENALQNKTNDLTDKIIEDELITANSINALVEASGLVSSNNEITYVKKANPYYIGEASSISDAINILDENLNIVQKLIETSVRKAITDLINANPSLQMNNPFEVPSTNNQ